MSRKDQMWRFIPGLNRLAGFEPEQPTGDFQDDGNGSAVMAKSGQNSNFQFSTSRRSQRGAAATEPSPEIVPIANPRTALDIYSSHFGLTARPFALAPDPDFLFWSAAHKAAYTMLEYGVLSHAPITMITGEVGTGKTTLLHHLLRSLGPEVRVGLISNPSGSRSELLRWVLMALGQQSLPDETYVDLFGRFQSFAISEYAHGRRVVLIFDEAQNLSREALEELRMFTNINSGKDELLHLVLIAQPELREVVTRPDMRQFSQRVASSFHLSEMDLATVRSYIKHRLKVAGRVKSVFNDGAIGLIFEATEGVPRLVNRLCDLAMVYAFNNGSDNVNISVVQQVLDDGVFLALNARASKGAN